MPELRTDSYRAVSSRAALTAGLLALAVAGATLVDQLRDQGSNVDARFFFDLWLLVFLAASLATLGFLGREARRCGKPLFSDEFKLAVSCVLPSFFAGGAISGCLTITSGLPLFPAVFWVVFYGVGLLSLRPFAPSAMIVLGWAFLITGIGAFVYLLNETMMPEFDLPTPTNLYPSAIMGLTFGCYHLFYAAWMWARPTVQKATR